MDEAIYNLLLTGATGLSLFGTLRFRFIGDGAANAAAEPQKPGDAAPQQQGFELAQVAMEGDIIVPALAGLRRIALRGVGYGTAAGAVWQTLSSTGTTPRVVVQFNFSENFQITGGVTWLAVPGAPAAFGMLGKQLGK